MATQYPNVLDSDLEIPPVNDDITEIGGDAINAIRSAIFAIEAELGVHAAGAMSSLAQRIGGVIDENGNVRPSALAGIGLINLPITNSQISNTAGIQESKLQLTYTTQFLYNLFANLQTAVDILNDFVSITGAKVEPHLAGTAFRHKLSHIDVDSATLTRVDMENGNSEPHNVTNAFKLVEEISNDLLDHTRADKINNNTTPPANQAHNASAIYINPTYFISVPQTANDLQTFAEYVDSSSLALLGSRTQNLFDNGIPRASRTTSLNDLSAAEMIIPPTNAIAYLLYSASTIPVDDIDHGDDIITLQPSSGSLTSNTFDAQFSQVRAGDHLTITYDNQTPTVTFKVDSVKKFLNGSSRVYSVRIHGKNLKASSTAIVKIHRPFYHDDKFHSLSVAPANNSFGSIPSLIINSPRGASTLGIGFYPDKIDTTHYNLYLAFYPTGNPLEKVEFLPAIDVTANQGSRGGMYTPEQIAFNINEAVRKPGFNYRFNAFVYRGQVGISLADHYNNASFSIIAGVPDSNGVYQANANSSYPQNIIDNYSGNDALGFGLMGSGIAGPPFNTSYPTPISALTNPTVIISPQRRDYFYVDGVEKDNFALEKYIARDGYGDGYWNGTLITRTSLSGRVEVIYEVDLDLSSTGLKAGKTLVVQPAVPFTSGSYNKVDYGRFTISSVVFNNCPGPDPVTLITVNDAIHGMGTSPSVSSSNIPVKIYFTEDSVSFDREQISDGVTTSGMRRFFEVYLDTNGESFTHERARFNAAGNNTVVDSANNFILYSSAELSSLRILDISPKMRGYSYLGQYRKINLFIESFDEITGIFSGYLCKYDYPSTYTKQGPTTIGKKGEIARFFTDTGVDYIDLKFDIDASVSSFTSKQIDIQLYDSLELNQERIMIGQCLVDDITNRVLLVSDVRPFGNISEKQLSTSALNYISAPERLLLENGLIRGFDIKSVTNGVVSLKGGAALIDGKVVEFNDKEIKVPSLHEALYPAYTTLLPVLPWYLCLNSKGDLEWVMCTELTSSYSYGSLDHNRIVKVKNQATPSNPAFGIRATYLNKLITDYKDLVPLYKISGATNNSGVLLSTSTPQDLRRYVASGYGGMSSPMVLGKNGSFRTFDALFNVISEITVSSSYAITKSNVLGQEVIVRDNFVIDGLGFYFEHPVTFKGDGGIFTCNVAAVAGKNVIFKNVKFEVASDQGLIISQSNVEFDHCKFNFTYDANGSFPYVSTRPSNPERGCIFASSLLGDAGKRNIKITNCHFSSPKSNRFPFISLLIASADGYYSNIDISNNYFESLTDADTQAVISISNNSAATASLYSGSRVTNCNISNNICNKLQMIVVSSKPNGSNKISDAIVPVNFKIQGNTCGSICYFTRDGGASYAASGEYGRIVDKASGLYIKDNTCKYIFNGTMYGLRNVEGSSNTILSDIATSQRIFSSNTIISGNMCSWMHVGVKNPSKVLSTTWERPTLLIENNRMVSYPTILTVYQSTPLTIPNAGLLVDSVEGD